MDRIHIRDLALRCVIGVYPDERRQKQDVILNLVFECDVARAAATARLEHTVDYKTIKKRRPAISSCWKRSPRASPRSAWNTRA